LNLPGVVDIVQSDACNQPSNQSLASSRRTIQIFGTEFRDGRLEPLMFPIQQNDIGAPCSFARSDGPHEPVTAPNRERAALFAEQASPYRIFPVRRVNDNFPNIMPPGSGTPCRFACRQSANRPTEVWAVPRGAFVSFLEHRQQMLDFRVHNPPPQVSAPSHPRGFSNIAEVARILNAAKIGAQKRSRERPLTGERSLYSISTNRSI
jgi:hypothetical protein